jgi:signal transduction histidine kinase/ligand-binding sensor domain-containing protein
MVLLLYVPAMQRKWLSRRSAIHAAVALALTLAPPRARGLGPDLPFTHWTPEQGLSQASVWAIAQDRQGFLWFGTESGLNRFDGQEIRVFGQGEPGLAGAFVRAIVEVGDSLWIAMDPGGLARFDLRTETFEIFRHNPEDPDDPAGLAEDLVVALAVDPGGALWIATRHGRLHRMAAGAHSFEQLPTDSLAGDVHALLVDTAGRLWVGTAEGLYRRRPGEASFQRQGAPGSAQPLSDQRLTHLREDAAGRLWVASRGGLDRLDPESGRIERRLLVGEFVTTSLETGDGVLWVGLAGGGLAAFPADDKAQQSPPLRYRHRALDPQSLLSDTVRVLFEDRSGVLWIGTEQGGVDGLTLSRRGLGLCRTALTPEGSRPLRGVMALAQEGADHLWVGTRDQGLFRLSPHPAQARRWGRGDGSPEALDSDRISALLALPAGGVLAATAEGSLYRMVQERLRRFPTFTHRSLRALHRGPGETLWVATWGAGLFQLTSEGEVLRHLTTAAESPDALEDDIVLCLETTADGALWAGTWSGGLHRIDPSTGQARVLREGPRSDRIASLLAVEDALWIGTDRGLDRLELTTGTFEGIPDFDGRIVYSLRRDGRGHLWLGTDFGLWHFDPETLAREHFLSRHGLQANEFNVGAAVDSPDGTLVFGGTEGLNRVRPHAVGDDFSSFRAKAEHRLGLSALSTPRHTFAGGQLFSWIDRGIPLELAPDERDLTFTIAWLETADPTAQRFAYRLEGRDTEWIELGRQRTGSLHDLRPGRDTLHLAAWQDGAGDPRVELRLPLRVQPRLTERPWVRALLALLALALLGAALGVGHTLRLRRAMRAGAEALEVRQRLLEAGERERVLVAQELHDGPLQRIHALQLAASRASALPSETLRPALATLVAEVRHLCTRMRSPVLDLGLEAALRELADGVRREHPGLALTLHLEEKPWPPEIAQVLYRVCQEALSNVARHAAAHTVEVALCHRGTQVTLEVHDDGRGFTPPPRWIELARRGHLGILGMEERLDSLGGTLTIHSTPGAGTRVGATVPFTDDLDAPGRRREA